RSIEVNPGLERRLVDRAKSSRSQHLAELFLVVNLLVLAVLVDRIVDVIDQRPGFRSNAVEHAGRIERREMLFVAAQVCVEQYPEIRQDDAKNTAAAQRPVAIGYEFERVMILQVLEEVRRVDIG